MSAALPLPTPTAATVLASLRAVSLPGVRVSVDGDADLPGDAAIVTYTRSGPAFAGAATLVWMVQVLVEAAQGRVPEPTIQRATLADADLLERLLTQVRVLAACTWERVPCPVRAEPGWSSAWVRDHGRSAS